ncbi:MAG: hypothetical protein HQK59_04375 [Deltaproteobacteria bacterium]|nr:hypothetical protein [Deltaproteobacteria bacterium]
MKVTSLHIKDFRGIEDLHLEFNEKMNILVGINGVGKFNDFLVLFQTSTEACGQNIRQNLFEQEGAEIVWVTDYSKVNEHTVLNAPIWQDHEMKPRQVLKG